jgi:hypothetical protein
MERTQGTERVPATGHTPGVDGLQVAAPGVEDAKDVLLAILAAGAAPAEAMELLMGRFGLPDVLEAFRSVPCHWRELERIHRSVFDLLGIGPLVECRQATAKALVTAAPFPEAQAGLRAALATTDAAAGEAVAVLDDLSKGNPGAALAMAMLLGSVGRWTEFFGWFKGDAAAFAQTVGPRLAMAGGKRATLTYTNHPGATLGLPDHTLVPGDLACHGAKGLRALPEGLIVTGSLALDNCVNLERLPDHLKVGRTLRLSGCAVLRSLPPGLDVDDLTLKGCGAWDRIIPADAVIRGRIHLAPDRALRLTEFRALADPFAPAVEGGQP